MRAALAGRGSPMLERNGWEQCESPSDGGDSCDLTGADIPKGEQVWWRSGGGEDWREGSYASRRAAFMEGHANERWRHYSNPRSRWWRVLRPGKPLNA